MGSAVRTRAYRTDDWSALCRIHDAARRHELDAAGLGAAYLTLEQTAANEGLFDYAVLVAEDEDGVQGFAAHNDDELAWLYVRPDRYRRGIGRRLAQEIMHRSHGAMAVEVLVGNEAALGLYLDLGFKIAARAEGRLPGNEAFKASVFVLEWKRGERVPD
jgi:ribosomal protein S18 acetylase RimI-like enzyme